MSFVDEGPSGVYLFIMKPIIRRLAQELAEHVKQGAKLLAEFCADVVVEAVQKRERSQAIIRGGGQ